MPSGAKKRKAAKRRKEQQQLGAHSPGSPTSPTASPRHPPEGNGVREEDDELTSQEGKGTESGGEFPSPSARGGHHYTSEVETDEEEAITRVKAEGEAKGKHERETTVPVDTINIMENTENGGSEQPTEPLIPQKADDEVTKTTEVEVPVAVVKVQNDDVPPPLPLSDPIPLSYAEDLISKVEEVNVELQSEEAKEVDVVSGITPPLIEHKQSDAVDAYNTVETSVPIIEEVVPASVVPIESLEVVESAAETQSSTNQENAIVLSQAASEQPDLGAESHLYTVTREIAATTEVIQSTPLRQRTSWLGCCGIFDVITGANR